MLARPLIQTTVVEVSGSDEKDAEKKARAKARRLPADAWHGTFKKHDYGLDAVVVLSEDELEERESPYQVIRRLSSSFQYLLLKADQEEGYGTLLLEPWLANEHPIHVADLLSDWRSAVENLHQASIVGFHDWLQETYDKRNGRSFGRVIFLAPYLESRKKPTDSEPDTDPDEQ